MRLSSVDLVQEPSWGDVLLDVGTGATAGTGVLREALAGLGVHNREPAVARRTRTG
jgi:hypothetical protein